RPTAVPGGGRTWQKVTAGTETTCGLATDGTLLCWGSNTQGLAGNAGAGNPLVFPSALPASAGTFTQASLTAPAGCGLRPAGAFACFGSGANGEFGDDALFYETPVRVAGSPP